MLTYRAMSSCLMWTWKLQELIRTNELCVEANIFEEEIEVELQKLEQKSKESVDRNLALHMKIDQEADASISRINECRQQSHGELEEKISCRMRELDEHRVALTAMMLCSQEFVSMSISVAYCMLL